MPQVYIADNLAYLRKQRGLQQTQVAEFIGKGATTVSGWENKRSQPDYEDLLSLCKFFGVTLENLLYCDLQNVQVSENREMEENGQNVQAIVSPIVQESPKNEGETSELRRRVAELEKTVEVQREMIRILNMAVEGLRDSNSVLVRDNEVLGSVLRLEKLGLPEVGQDGQKKTSKPAG